MPLFSRSKVPKKSADKTKPNLATPCKSNSSSRSNTTALSWSPSTTHATRLSPLSFSSSYSVPTLRTAPPRRKGSSQSLAAYASQNLMLRSRNSSLSTVSRISPNSYEMMFEMGSDKPRKYKPHGRSPLSSPPMSPPMDDDSSDRADISDVSTAPSTVNSASVSSSSSLASSLSSTLESSAFDIYFKLHPHMQSRAPSRSHNTTRPDHAISNDKPPRLSTAYDVDYKGQRIVPRPSTACEVDYRGQKVIPARASISHLPSTSIGLDSKAQRLEIITRAVSKPSAACEVDLKMQYPALSRNTTQPSGVKVPRRKRLWQVVG